MRNLAVLLLSVVAGLVMVSSVALAQGLQPLLANYDLSKSVTKTGPITDLTWANTHCVLFVDAKDDSGKVSNLAIELPNPRLLIDLKVTPITLQPGKEVTVTFNPSTDPPNRGLVKSLSMDGKQLFDTNKLNAEVEQAVLPPPPQKKK